MPHEWQSHHRERRFGRPASRPSSDSWFDDEVFLANHVDTPRNGGAGRVTAPRARRPGGNLAQMGCGLPGACLRAKCTSEISLPGRYARSTFGVDPQVAHLGDLPDYRKQFPQLLASAGVAYVIMTRIGPNDKSLFRRLRERGQPRHHDPEEGATLRLADPVLCRDAGQLRRRVSEFYGRIARRPGSQPNRGCTAQPKLAVKPYEIKTVQLPLRP